ncbi:MmcB family DNA repair protein [Thermoactinomyces sp. DSM 45892]|uniref:MmcB family DNA repair protein n=1 Tax=Thermoactinomyces sp. DSM 45892 TaxID=1882753 RepID=UPI0008943BAB|nr:MmcB family DNA repair protein [Thermoactinomyces sp. DSM 45892]SDY86483.1 Protein of unknown function [Thermoactinomyces sp. DSM 45892]
MITGKDERSLWAIQKLREGWKPADLKKHGFTDSQSKKLSQFTNCLLQLEEHCQTDHVQKWSQLGLKGLFLLSMFKQNDWEGLGEILLSVDPRIKRDDLVQYPALIQAKRERIEAVETGVRFKVRDLERERGKLEETVAIIKKNREESKKLLPDLLQKVENDEALDFLMDHLGHRNGQICLAKRLDYNWQRNLKKKGIIILKEEDDPEDKWKTLRTHYVMDVIAIAEDYQRRKKRGYRTEYDYEHVPQNDWVYWDIPEEAEYWGIDSLSKLKGIKLTQEKKRLKEIEKEIQQAEEGFKSFRKRRPESFSESLHRSNQFASFDMEKHGQLQALGLKWLYNKGYMVTTELTLPDNLRCDVIGVDKEGKICILECKASYQDYTKDEKWQRYLKYCDSYYFVAEKDLLHWMQKDSQCENVGLLKAHSKHLEIDRECKPMSEAEQSEDTAFNIGRQLSRRFSFGH